MKLTKQTSKGEAVIEVVNGFATATLNGQPTGCSSGSVQYVKPFGPNNEFVGGICKVALTQAEADEIERMLKIVEPATTQDSGEGRSGIYQHSFTAQSRRSGNINKFSKGGVL